MKIKSGKLSDISWTNGFWIFLDIGFSNQVRSCGLLLHDTHPQELKFSDAVSTVIDTVGFHDRLNLLIEAPLSVAFDKSGNPKGRSIEKSGSKTRYWYVGPGAVVMVATFYLLRALSDATSNCVIQLFEGFVSYKEKSKKSSHSKDVLLLREVIKEPEKFSSCIYSPESLRLDDFDRLESAFKVGGMDFGVPPLIMRES